MLLFNLLIPVAVLVTAVGSYNDVVKPAAKATYKTGVVVYEKSVEIIKDVTTEDSE
tara:strand:+ start:795 stop:962 length:168 start_codon:yes stop_codon:yes gene_type:complete